MTITEPFVLPEDVQLVPVRDLPLEVRAGVGSSDEDIAVSRPHTRIKSTIVDPHFAELLREFRTAKTIVDAVVRYSQNRNLEPQKILEDAYPILERFIYSQILLPAGSQKVDPIVPCFQAGDRIATYRVVKCIQLMEDTELYQARAENDTLVAIKIVRPNAGENWLSTYEREAAILKHLDGTSSPKFIQQGFHDGRIFIAMEWCEGVNAFVEAYRLRQLPEAQRLPRLFDLCCKVAEAYAHLHAQRVIHGDVHHGNILVAEGHVKVIDYGYGLLQDGMGGLQEPTRGGHAYFLDPDYTKAQLQNSMPPRATVQSELYTLGALIYHLLTGRDYLEFSVEQQTMYRQIAEEPPLPLKQTLGLDWAEMDAIFQRALAKEPGDRPQSLEEFVSLLRSVKPHVLRVATETTVPVDLSELQPLLDRVLEKTSTPHGPLFAKWEDKPICSAHSGMTGVAHMLYRIASVQRNARLLAMADLWVNRSAALMGAEKAFYVPELQILPESAGRISPHHTASGIYLAQGLISAAMGDVVTQQMAINQFVLASQAACDNPDLTLGIASTIMGCALLYDALPSSGWVDGNGLLALGDHRMEELWMWITHLPEVKDCPENMYLGMAHGWAGYLYATLRWCQSAGRALPPALQERLAQLAALQEEDGRGVRWKVQLLGPHSKEEAKYMSGWCNGTAGFVFLWTLAYEMLGDEIYRRLAERAAWSVWQNPGPVVGLCCGYAGQAYALLDLYQHTGDENWLHCAQELARRAVQGTVQLVDVIPMQNSLYRGEIGVAALVADLQRPETACMPLFGREYRKSYGKNDLRKREDYL